MLLIDFFFPKLFDFSLLSPHSELSPESLVLFQTEAVYLHACILLDAAVYFK